MEPLQTGTRIRLELTDLAVGGDAVGRLDGLVVFVEGGAPGDTAEVELTEVHRHYARGRVRAVHAASPDRVAPPCPIYDACGGCQLQHLTYDAQLRLKSHIVREAMRIGHLTDVPVLPCLPTREWGYRNKMQLVAAFKPALPTNRGADRAARRPAKGAREIAAEADAVEPARAEDPMETGRAAGRKDPAKPPPALGAVNGEATRAGTAWLGLYERHSHRVVRMDDCLIAHPIANEILVAASAAIDRLGWEVYDERTGKGLIRHLVARVSEAAREALVVIVATRDTLPQLHQFVSMLRAKVPEVAGVMVNENPRRTNVILGPRTRHVWGRDHIVEEVAFPGEARRVRFRIGPTSFFQVNVAGLEAIGRLVHHYLQPRPTDVVVDGYCGVGAISLMVAPTVRKVIGIEEVDEAVQAAHENARLNDMRNADFVTEKVERELPRIFQRGERVDAVLLDPPRKGCDAAVLETIAKLRVPRVVYISCNPATLARDLALLAGMGYRADEIQPLDMFPQTSHVECVTRVRLNP